MELSEAIQFDKGLVEVGDSSAIGRLFSRAKAGAELTIGFLGGSITQGAQATDDTLCYAYRVFKWFEKSFPESRFTYVNAGIGATDSEYAAARVKEDLLDAHPDFVLMEFAVNDGCNEHFLEAYEGTLRQILNSKPDIAVVLMCNVFYDEGKSAERIHRQVARHYSIPMVSMRTTIYEAILSGDIKNRQITEDDLHPNDAGHRLVADVITTYLKSVAATCVCDKVQTREVFSGNCAQEAGSDAIAAEIVLPAPLTANRYEHSIKFDNRNDSTVRRDMSGFMPDNTARTAVKDCFRYGYSATTIGSFVEYEVEGACIAVQFRRTVNLPAPVARLIVDGDESSAVILDANFDETWGDMLVLTDVYMSERPAVHSVRIEIIEAHPDDKGDFYLAGIVVSG
ncbi:MAG: SGNH/GDSL hydrolase family protein [Lachnospiraceae bacterium]|nr:SGNH/GDSL hydrolase family protein [Lachnospiraceae bacterium]